MLICSSGSARNTSAGAGGGEGDRDTPSDQVLSDILDDVIDNLPDADRPAPDVNVLGNVETNRPRPDFAVSFFIKICYFVLFLRLRGLLTDIIGFLQEIKEKNARINAITQSLMQFETVTVKNPVSSNPGAPPVYPVQSSVSTRQVIVF